MLSIARPRPATSGTVSLAAKTHYSIPLAFKARRARLCTARATPTVSAADAGLTTRITTRIVVQGRNIEATPAIKAYCEEKVGKAIRNWTEGIKEVGVGGVGVEPPLPRGDPCAAIHGWWSRRDVQRPVGAGAGGGGCTPGGDGGGGTSPQQDSHRS